MRHYKHANKLAGPIPLEKYGVYDNYASHCVK